MDWQSVFAGIAAAVAIGSLAFQVKHASDRRTWESQQTSRREHFEKTLDRRQREWQQQQEAQRQQERAEDHVRAKDAATPKLRVTVSPGVRWWGKSVVPLYTTKVENIGRVNVFVNNVYFRNQDGEAMYDKFDTTVNIDNWSHVQLTTMELPANLQPTQSFQVCWIQSILKDTLQNSYQEKAAVKAIAQDGTGNEYISEDFIIDLDAPDTA